MQTSLSPLRTHSLPYLLSLSLFLFLYLSLPLRPLSLPLLCFHLFHAPHSQAMSWNKSIYKTRLGCGSYGRRGSFPGPDNSTFSQPRYRIIPFCHARRQSKLWRVSLYLWHSYFGQCDSAATINHPRKHGRGNFRIFIPPNEAHSQLLHDRLDGDIKMHSH